MTRGMRSIDARDLNTLLSTVIAPPLAATFAARAPGHCMRVTDLSHELADLTCGRVRELKPEAQAYVLIGDHATPGAHDVTGTKLVELRNPLADGTLRPPLLVFLPAGLHASAEDSFSVATFEHLDLGALYSRARAHLLAQFPADIAQLAESVLHRLPKPPSDVAAVRYLLTIAVNGHDPSVVGAALYELGLLPDFGLHKSVVDLAHLLRRNGEKTEVVMDVTRSERARVHALGVTNPEYRRGLADSLREHGAEDPSRWLRRVALDAAAWPYAFDRWPLADATPQDRVFVQVIGTNLPRATEADRARGLEPDHLYLPLAEGGPKKFRVEFRTDPVPSKVASLARFVVEIISQDQGAVGVSASKKVWTRGEKSYVDFSLVRLSKGEWQTGWHFARVRPYTEEGSPVMLIDEDGQPVPWGGTLDNPDREYAHEVWFYVATDVEAEEAPEQRAVPRERSLEHARVKLRGALAEKKRRPVEVERVAWVEDRNVLEVSFGRAGLFHVSVTPELVALEREVLAHPREVGGRALLLDPKKGKPDLVLDAADPLLLTGPTQVFFEAREHYFRMLSGDAQFTTQAAPFHQPEVADAARAYAAAYQEAITALRERGALVELRTLLSLDTFRVTVQHRQGLLEASLVAPTHPLRAAWYAAWARLGSRWTEEPLTAEVRAALFDLDEHAFPTVVPNRDGRLHVPVGELAPGWTLCAPPTERDPRGLLGEVCGTLGVPEPVGEDGVRADELARRLRRYLVQHPYITTLTLNAFNAGQGGVLARALVELQKHEELREVVYDVRLFVDDPLAHGVGLGLTALLAPSDRTTDQAAEAFGLPTGDPLRPKLALSIRPTAVFRASPNGHRAHVTFLFDVFPPAEVTARRGRQADGNAPVHGLVQDFDVHYTETEDTARWERQPRFGIAESIDDGDELTPILASLPERYAVAATAVATGESSADLRPTVTLTLGGDQRTLLHQVHEASDWVFTVDRNLGVEFFDHGRVDRPEYLIDHSPTTSGRGHRLVVTSRATEELEAMLRPVLERYHLPPGKALATLTALRALSGRLALKLLSGANDQAEVLGLALARLFLEYQDALEDQLIVPLDVHPEFYRTEDVLDLHLRRTDLALFEMDEAARTVTCTLVEVKCYRDVGSLHHYQALKDDIFEQIDQSAARLAGLFGVPGTGQHPATSLLRARAFERLLRAYLERAERYGLVRPDTACEYRRFLATLEKGYTLVFKRSALIFDFTHPGHEQTRENGIEYHRVGYDAVVDLMHLAPEAAGMGVDLSMTMTATVPKLDEAAFLPSAKRRQARVQFEDPVDGRDVEEANTPAGPTPESQNQEPVSPPAPAVPAGTLPVEDTPVVITAEADTAGTHSDEVGLGPPVEPTPLPTAPLEYDVMLGTTKASPQYGLLGEFAGRRVALDLNETHTISLFGVQGGGKSYTLGTVVEMATVSLPHLNHLQKPLASVIFHYSQTQEYAPEFVSMRFPNDEADQLRRLKDQFGAEPAVLGDLVLLVPEDKVDIRRKEFPGVDIRPLLFAAAELQASHWRFLMNAIGNQSTYIRQLNRIMRDNRDHLTVERLRAAVEASTLPNSIKELAQQRLDLADAYIDDTTRIGDVIRPGRLIIVDLRDEFIEKDEALGLFVVLLQLFADARDGDQTFNKLVVFDEAHKYISDPELVKSLVEVIREMRHKGTSILIASQDPPSVPVEVIELSSQIILHKFNSPAWLKHIQRANAALADLTPDKMAQLRPGEAFVWSSKTTDAAFSERALKMTCRPRATRHGGATKTAVKS